MHEAIRTLAAWLVEGGELVIDATQRFDVALLAAGAVLHLVADVVRNGGWYTILRTAAAPRHESLRMRDVQAAVLAGGGANTLLPARAGDVLKIALVRRHLPAVPIPTLVATLVPETVFELVAGVALLAWALTAGYLPLALAAGALSWAGGHALVAGLLLVAAAVVAVGALSTLRRRAARVYDDLAAGLSILRRPRAFLTGVVTWQLAARVVRLPAIACCLAACGLPSAPAAVALAMAVEGGTRLPLAPASAGLRVGLLLYGLPAATGSAVSLGPVVAYVVGVRSIRIVVSLAVALGAVGAALGARSPWRALQMARGLSTRAAAVAPHATTGEP